jgi:hypothetical protein
VKEESEYTRLFQRIQKLRPGLPPDQTEKLVEFVESGVLKDEGEQFVFSSTEQSESGENEMGLFPSVRIEVLTSRMGSIWVRGSRKSFRVWGAAVYHLFGKCYRCIWRVDGDWS